MVALFAAAPFERTYLWGGDPRMLVAAFGIVLQLAGLILALAARIQLGRYGTPHLEVLDNHAIVQTGLYKRIRNPIYVGGIISRQAWAIVWVHRSHSSWGWSPTSH